jgi:apolipoprotein N-acyltransferase
MNRIKPVLAWLLAAIGSGGLYALASSLHPVWWAAWLAGAPVLIAAFHSRFWGGFATAFLASAIGSLPMFFYLLMVAPLPAAIGLVVVTGLLFALGVELAAGAHARLPAPVAVFAFPVWYAGLETLMAATSPHGTAGSLAYSQMDFMPALQVASLGGTAAVTFVVSLFSSVVAFAIADLGKSNRSVIAAATGFGVVALGLAYGATQRAQTTPAPTMTVAMAALDQKSELPSDWRAALAAYQTRLDEARAKGAQLVVLPEEISILPAADQPAMEAELSQWAKEAHATLEVGFRVMTAGAGGKARNRLFLFTPQGQTITYDKRHLIPGLESSQVDPSVNPVLVTKVDERTLGGAICKDWDFSEIGRRLSLGHAAIAVAPGWDFGKDGWLHGRMAMLRAVEGGFTLVRSARGGIMSVSDRNGRVLAEAPSGPDAPLLVAQAPVPNVTPTLYARFGDLFGWACLAGVVLFFGGILMRRPKAT